MKTLSKWLGIVSLLIILVMPFAYLFDQVSFSVMNGVLLIMTLVWFGSSFFWIGKSDIVTLEEDPLL